MSTSRVSPVLLQSGVIVNDPKLVQWLSKIDAFAGLDITALPPASQVVGVVLADGRVSMLDQTTRQEMDDALQFMQKLMLSFTATEKTLSGQPSTSLASRVQPATS